MVERRRTVIQGSPVGVCEHVAAVLEYVVVTENDEDFVAEGVGVADGSEWIGNEGLSLMMPECITEDGRESVLMGMGAREGHGSAVGNR